MTTTRKRVSKFPWDRDDGRLTSELIELRRQGFSYTDIAGILGERAGQPLSWNACRQKYMLLAGKRAMKRSGTPWKADGARLDRELERLRGLNWSYAAIAEELSRRTGQPVTARQCKNQFYAIRSRSRGDALRRFREQAETIRRLRERIELLEVVLEEHGINPVTAVTAAPVAA